MALLSGCGGAGEGADADGIQAYAAGDPATPGSADARASVAASADFEGTMQQLMLQLDVEAVTQVVGSSDPAAVMAFPPEQLIEAVLAGDIEARSIERATLEIDGVMGRLQVEGEDGYSIVDGTARVTRVVSPADRTVITMDPAKLAAASPGKEQDAAAHPVEEVGEREIRGYDATGYRFDFIGDNIATVWLSPALEAATGPIFDIWFELNPLGRIELGDGAPVRMVVVNPEVFAGGRSFMPAYSVTEFHDLQPGPVADDRFALPEGYDQVGMADMAAMGRATQ